MFNMRRLGILEHVCHPNFGKDDHVATLERNGVRLEVVGFGRAATRDQWLNQSSMGGSPCKRTRSATSTKSRGLPAARLLRI
jgi:hypothetical protein